MVLRAQWPLDIIAQFFYFVAEEKKWRQKNKAFYDWATTGTPVKIPRRILEADLETPIWVVQRTEYGWGALTSNVR